ncbi:YkgJ family cysteine cluster protein [uncultured Desulfovibrio sp.]|uniref:YkgJ family cysteine cluster protein n=1 Tax=uncultured Desulfovibrio sp. TaxID=167968 RepID=UPI001C3AE42D|nr:YkgJ family cysteine cluster protein [uncultured Desulfovibrio sp.]HIX40376.1 YkgJ family cysteine cluster protein [Candidatus Desulfovibrio intestinigallinarum]
MTNTAFDCRMCGHCCEGKGGIVVSPSDLQRLCDFLRMPADAVIAAYGEQAGDKLKIRCGEDGYCIFFRQGKGCIVHEGKPSICKAWPFFRGNIEDPESLALAKDFCPGINPDISHEDFAREGMAYLEKERLLASDTRTEANALILSHRQ